MAKVLEAAPSFRTGGATSWPRMSPRPKPMSSYDVAFEFFLTYSRPVFQVVFLVVFFHPYWLRFANHCLNTLGISERFFFALITVGTHHTIWATVNSFFLLADKFGWLERYRLPTPIASRPSSSLKREAIIGSLFGGLPMFAGSYIFFPLYQYFGMPSPLSPLPSIMSLWKTYAIVKFGSSLTFDLVHRLIHSTRIYKKIHSKHHRFIATMSIAAEFAHPIEGSGPILVPLVMGMHPYAWCAWLCWEQINAGITHSGYCFYIYPGQLNKLPRFLGLGFLAEEAAYHHHHHFRNKGNFSTSYWDALWGTHDDWLHLGRAQGYIHSLHEQELARKGKEKKKEK